jgi:hypothetical protein
MLLSELPLGAIMSLNRRFSCAAVCATLLLTASLTGCGTKTEKILELVALGTGNWQLSSTAPSAARLPALSGELSGSSLAATGIFHTDSLTACVAPTTAIELGGSANDDGVLTLTGDLAGGTLTVTGTLAADGKSFSSATYNVSGGTCAFMTPATANGQNFSPVSGNYAGSFSDPDGNVIHITAVLTQTPVSDTDGNFQLSGTGTFPSNPCFNSPVSIANSQVTGGNFTVTYADNTTNNSVTASGTFSTDGTTLTVNSWTLTGSCGPDAGMGLLSKP